MNIKNKLIFEINDIVYKKNKDEWLLKTKCYLSIDLLCKELLQEWGCGGYRVFVLSDPFMKEEGKRIADRLEGVCAVLHGKKTRAEKERIEDVLVAQSFGRDTVIIALGGGVTTDLAGFIASTYMRGVPLVLIPTTLLAMVDAAWGGKTGIDLPVCKNGIGTFYTPVAVFVDTRYLKTLPGQELRNGLAEMLKIGLVRDRMLWEQLLVEGVTEATIHRAILNKMQVIELDPFEKGMRQILNFGHTIGHALEIATGYHMAHGEAVLWGCLMESWLSKELNYLSLNQFQEIDAFYRSLYLTMPVLCNRSKILESMHLDKKNRSGKVRFVLLENLGSFLKVEEQYTHTLDLSVVEQALLWMETYVPYLSF